MSKKIWISFLLSYLFLFNIASALALAKEIPATKKAQTPTPPTKTAVKATSLPKTTTTEQGDKGGVQNENFGNAEIHLSDVEPLQKPLPKKRGIMDELYRTHPGSFDETGYDTNEDPVPEESFSGSTSDLEEKPFYRYSDSAFLNDDGYSENEGRTKRTADLDELYNRPQERQIELTPEEVMTLLNLLEETRAYGEGHTNLMPYDNTVDSIEADMKDEGAYKDKIGNNYGGGYENGFEPYQPDIKRYPTGRRRRNSLFEHQASNIPILRRVIL